MQNHITIKYCTQCQWMLRATWIAQEILSTFEEDISTISLEPGKGGVFEIQVNEILIWSLKKERKFPQPKDFKNVLEISYLLINLYLIQTVIHDYRSTR